MSCGTKYAAEILKKKKENIIIKIRYFNYLPLF